jgi:hypothetical protein
VSYSSRIQVPHPCAKSEILVRNPTLLKLFIERNLTHIFILKRDVSIFMPDVLLGTTRVPFFRTAASIFITAFLDFDWLEKVGHIPGERVNERLCGCWHRGNVPAKPPKYPSLRGVHGRRKFANLTPNYSTP